MLVAGILSKIRIEEIGDYFYRLRCVTINHSKVFENQGMMTLKKH